LVGLRLDAARSKPLDRVAGSLKGILPVHICDQVDFHS
jgi:hypothetical protein